MSISLTLSDTSGASVTYDETTIKSDTTIEQVSGKSTNTVLSGNVFTDYVYKKQQWTFSWDWMSASDYQELLGFYNRQFTLNKYPTAQIITPSGTVESVVAMDINVQTITNMCGVVEGITITLRESVQL